MSEKQRQTGTESIQRQQNQPLSPEQQQRFEREKQEIIMLSKAQRNLLSNEVISSYLKNYNNIDLSKYSPEIQKKFTEEVSILFEEFKNFDTSMITSLRSIREGMSFGMEAQKSDEFYRNMIIGNALQTRILAIKIFLDNTKGETIQIDERSYNKFDYNSYRSDIQKIDAHLGVDMLNSIDVKRNNINLKRVFSDRISQQIDPSNTRYNLIMADITRLPNVIGNKGFENLRSVKLKNGKTVDLGQIFNMYNYVYTSFQGKNSVFQSGNRQINESKKGLGLNESKYGVGYNKIKDTYKDKFEELNLENMGLADLIIMMRVIFSVIPVAGDSVGGYDDMKQALAGVNFDGSMHGLGENVFMHLIGGLQLSIVGGWFAKLAKGPKLAKAILTLGKIVDKISKSPEMLQDLARNERVMKMLEGMKALGGDLGNKVNDILINLQQKNGMILNIHENNQFSPRSNTRLDYRGNTTMHYYDLSRLTKVDNPNDKMIDRSGMNSPIEKEDLNYTQEQIRRILRDFKDMGTPPKESPQDMRDRLTRKRKGGARDPEHILDIAKQQGAVLLREGEKLMRANPGIPGSELGQLIRKRADELGIKITPTQGKIIDAQMRKYDELINNNPLYKKGIVNDYDIDLVINVVNQQQDFVKSIFKKHVLDYYPAKEKMDFIYQSTEYLFRSGKIEAIKDPSILEALLVIRKLTQDKGSLTTIDISSLKRYYSEQSSIDHIADSIIPYLGILVDLVSYPGATLLKYPIEILNGKSEKLRIMQGGVDNGSFDKGVILGNYSKDGKFIYIGDTSKVDVIEHEYQHFLNDTFLSSELLSKAVGNSVQNVQRQERIVGRILSESSISKSLWSSMQDELCSYIERNGILPKNIDPYLSSTLKIKHQNGEIPKTHIQDMENAIKSLGSYFDNPLVSRDMLVGIIRTSHSMDDMLARLRKNFGTLIKVQDTTKATDLYGLEPGNRVRNPLPD